MDRPIGPIHYDFDVVVVAAVLAVILSALAAWLALGPAPVVMRLRRLALPTAWSAPARAPATPAQPPQSLLAATPTKAACSVLVGFVTWWFIGGVAGVALGAGSGSLAWLGLRRAESAAAVREREARVQALPLVADLLASAVAAGSPPLAAAEAVGAAVGGPIGQALRAAAAAAQIAADPAGGWSTLATDPVLRPLARALAGSTVRGTSPVDVLIRVAHDARDTARWAAQARARSLGARAAVPLGLCLLPAFVLVGIVPVVVTAGPLLP